MTEGANLTELWVAIRAGATARELPVFDDLPALPRGYDDDIACPIARWSGEWEDFLDLAARARARLVYLVGLSFDRDAELRTRAGDATALDDTVADEASDEAAGWLLTRLRDQTEEWAGREGELMSLTCAWVRDGVFHSFQREAEWFAAFDAAAGSVLTEAEAVETENRRLRSVEEAKRLHERACEMARHPRFAEATSEAKREHMAGQLFPNLSLRDRRDIAERAALIYWWDVEPIERVTKAERVRALYDAGESIRGIAAALKMSEAKVREALAAPV